MLRQLGYSAYGNEGGNVTGPRIAVTSGDPAGIGPEIMARAAAVLRERVAHGSSHSSSLARARPIAKR